MIGAFLAKRTSRAAAWGLGVFAAAAAGCAENPNRATGAPGARGATSSGEAVEVIAHTYLPRPERENYWEPVVLAPGEPRFLLQIHPRLKTPAEGPWTLRIVDSSGASAATFPGLRVDVATGGITLLCEAARFSRGDWTVEMDLEEGGMTSGASRHVFRFRVQ